VIRHLLISLMLLIGVPSLAVAASFDCDRAATETEIAICGDPELSALDDLMSVVWRFETRTVLDISTQKKWLNKRDECASKIKCLTDMFVERLKSKPFDLGDFELIELYDIISKSTKFYLINAVYYAYNSEIIIEAISSSKLSPVKWVNPQFDEEIITCDLQIINKNTIPLFEETSVIGWTNLIDQGYADKEVIAGEVSVFTKWVGHGDQSQEIIYHLMGDKLVPIRGKVDNCSDQQKKYARIVFQ
jgi:uncharacterized protein YecT (DUF1311 family)